MNQRKVYIERGLSDGKLHILDWFDEVLCNLIIEGWWLRERSKKDLRRYQVLMINLESLIIQSGERMFWLESGCRVREAGAKWQCKSRSEETERWIIPALSNYICLHIKVQTRQPCPQNLHQQFSFVFKERVFLRIETLANPIVGD